MTEYRYSVYLKFTNVRGIFYLNNSACKFNCLKVTPEQLMAHHLKWLPPENAEFVLALDRMHAAGSLSLVCDGYRRLTGHEPRTFEQFIEQKRTLVKCSQK